MLTKPRRALSSVFILLSLTALIPALTGCSLLGNAPDGPVAGAGMVGKVYGGNQPVSGAHVYLMAATVSGVGSAGYGLASTSLLSGASTGHTDSVGAYVLTGATGTFSITSDYTCPTATTQVYLYALGGNPGAGTNNAASFMAALGSCGNLTSATTVQVNELTTVAAAYALAGFATDALHISIPQYSVGTTADTLAQTDLQNAFANAGNLVSTATGTALTTTPGGNGTPATAQVITLGNILAACINSASSSSTNCTTLLGNAGSTGGATGTIPTETATAAINVAHYPYVSSAVMTNLYGLAGASGAPFTGGDSSTPSDFTVAISYTGGGTNQPQSVAIDAAGDVWVGNPISQVISEFAPSGVALSGSTGYGGLGVGGINGPAGISIDSSGNAWVANGNNNTLSKFSSSGAAISPAGGYTGGGLNGPYGLAIAASGNVWAFNVGNPNSLSEFTSSGSAVAGSPFAGGGLSYPTGIAFDSSANVWVANNNGNSVSKFTSAGAVVAGSPFAVGGISGPNGLALDSSGNVWVANSASVSKLTSAGAAVAGSPFTGGGLNGDRGIAVDGAGRVWVANIVNNSISALSSTGTALSPATTGYTGGSMNGPYGLAVDGSGNVWVVNSSASSATAGVTELVGAATPVVTPIVANLIAPYSAPASKP